jgi:hypothetical protein
MATLKQRGKEGKGEGRRNVIRMLHQREREREREKERERERKREKEREREKKREKERERERKREREREEMYFVNELSECRKKDRPQHCTATAKKKKEKVVA